MFKMTILNIYIIGILVDLKYCTYSRYVQSFPQDDIFYMLRKLDYIWVYGLSPYKTSLDNLKYGS